MVQLLFHVVVWVSRTSAATILYDEDISRENNDFQAGGYRLSAGGWKLDVGGLGWTLGAGGSMLKPGAGAGGGPEV